MNNKEQIECETLRPLVADKETGRVMVEGLKEEEEIVSYAVKGKDNGLYASVLTFTGNHPSLPCPNLSFMTDEERAEDMRLGVDEFMKFNDAVSLSNKFAGANDSNFNNGEEPDNYYD